MTPIDLARKYRAKRHEAQTAVDRVNMLTYRIANRLAGLNFDDMSDTERQISDLLGREGYLFFDENGDCREL